MNKTSTLLRPYLRKLILKTHPDFFYHDKIKKQTNATSLSKLYNVLQPEQKTSQSLKLEFFTKDKKSVKATVQFQTNDTEWNKTSTFFQLCQQLDIPVLQSDLDMVNQMMVKEQPKSKTPHKSLGKEFAERLYKQQQQQQSTQSIPWTAEQVLKHKLIMFDPSVDKRTMASKLGSWLPELQPEKWWGKIPVLVTKEPLPSELTKGILNIQSNMELEDVKKYIDRELQESKTSGL